MELVPSGQKLLVDAYCGAGFFAKALLDKFERVIGIDWDRFAIQAAQRNATAKETYLAGDIDAALAQVGAVNRTAPVRLASTAPTSQRDTTLIVDPPATGLTDSVRKAIVDLAPASLIYVSCNPATLARDLKAISEKFTIASVTPLDMFPQTAEIEVVASLRRID
jgi:23S rRNA (uracil1939-C5)-methyltransferase